MNDTNKKYIWATWDILAIGFLLVLVRTVNAAPANVNNAALLYHKAFSLCPDPNSIPDKTIRAVYLSGTSAEDIAKYRKYVEDYQHVIRLVRAASNMSQCNWAIQHLQGEDIRMKRTELLMSSFPFLMSANVRVHAYDGEYRTALSESLILQRVARHIKEDQDEFLGISFLMERTALCCIHRVLDVMPPDKKILKWLREQLASEPPLSELFPAMIKQGVERTIGDLYKKDEFFFSGLRQELSEIASTEGQRKEVLAFSDEELIRLICEPYKKAFDSVLMTLDKKMSFEETYTEIQRQVEEYWNQVKNNPSIVMIMLHGEAESWLHLYGTVATHAARFNALKAAVELYLLKAKAGQLPQTLPEYLPKDPLSGGKNFEYQITEEGFKLRSTSAEAKNIKRYGIVQYEFKVPK